MPHYWNPRSALEKILLSNAIQNPWCQRNWKVPVLNKRLIKRRDITTVCWISRFINTLNKYAQSIKTTNKYSVTTYIRRYSMLLSFRVCHFSSSIIALQNIRYDEWNLFASNSIPSQESNTNWNMRAFNQRVPSALDIVSS